MPQEHGGQQEWLRLRREAEQALVDLVERYREGDGDPLSGLRGA
jgi:hypothetical protein